MNKFYSIPANVLLISLIILSNLKSIAQTPSFSWVKTIGGTSNDRGKSIAIDPTNGDFYVTGYFTATVDFDPGPGVVNLTAPGALTDNEIFLTKFNAAGNLIWAKQMGGSSSERPEVIKMDPVTRNIYIAGDFRDTADFDPGPGVANLMSASSQSDCYVTRLDSAGNFVWAKRLGANGGVCNDLTIDNAGNVLTAGEFQDTADFDPGAGVYNLISAGGIDAFISKLDNNGNFVWAKSVGSLTLERCYAIAVDDTNNVFVTGSYTNNCDFDPDPADTVNLVSLGSNDIYVLKLDASGDFKWVHRIGGSDNDGARALLLDDVGNIYCAGYFSGTVVFHYAGTSSVIHTAAGSNDVFVVKLNAGAGFVWARKMGGTMVDVCATLAFDQAGNIYGSGWFFGTADFDPGAGVVNLISAGNTDAYIFKLDTAGILQWTTSFGGPDQTDVETIQVDAAGNVFTTGTYVGTADFDPGLPLVNVTAAGLSDIFIHKLGQGPVSVYENNFENLFSIYPNPVNQSLVISHPSFEKKNCEIKIVDVLGKEIWKSKIRGLKSEIDVSKFENGIYFIQLIPSSVVIVQTQKFIVQH